MIQIYQHFLASIFAAKEINENPHLLPNITLGIHIYNCYFSPRWTYQASLELFSTQGRFIPNYKCDRVSNPVAVIGGSTSEISLYMADILSIYKIPQFIYGSAPLINKKADAVLYHQLFPDVAHMYKGILQLLLYFRWTWIGVLSGHDDNVERFEHTVVPMFIQRGICFDFILRIPMMSFSSSILDMAQEAYKTYDLIYNSTVNAMIIHGEINTMVVLRTFPRYSETMDESTKGKWKVWIMTSQIDFTSVPLQRTWRADFLHGNIYLSVHSHEIEGFQKFLQIIKPTLENKDNLFQEFWEEAFLCSFSPSLVDGENTKICSGEEKLENLPASVFEMTMTGHSYSIYNAVYTVAHALHAMHSLRFKHRARVGEGRWKLLSQQLWKVMSSAY
uniref:vomeronasal type-2 receptor 26-like n=1 Tax=Podarcis muralis TaxID=64176 RepID=UPI00109EEE3E|nr:vomeronasal type-2 receptor 26-like [Podarcis muralis]